MLASGQAGGGGRITTEAVAAVGTKVTGHTVGRVERLAGSVGNHDFMLFTSAGDFVLKASSVQDLRPEAWACQRVRQEGVTAPEIVHLETEALALPMPFLLMRRLPGKPVDHSSPALRGAGEQLAIVHSISLHGYGALTVTGAAAAGTSDSWASFVGDLTSGLVELEANGVLPEPLATAASGTLNQAADHLAFDDPAALLHGDLKLMHIFATPEHDVSIIDWGDACAGDPRLDLARLSMAGADALTAVMSGYGSQLTPELSRTLACYRLVWNIDALTYEYRAGGDWFDAYRRGITTALVELA
jgi:aminoglycoside phosphotransferase (APT) family kinase protein